MASGHKTGGRHKGVPNKVTAEFKDMILTALSDAGGVDYLCSIARDQPAVFCTLLGKVLPMTVAGDPEQPVKQIFEVTWQWPGDKAEGLAAATDRPRGHTHERGSPTQRQAGLDCRAAGTAPASRALR